MQALRSAAVLVHEQGIASLPSMYSLTDDARILHLDNVGLFLHHKLTYPSSDDGYVITTILTGMSLQS